MKAALRQAPALRERLALAGDRVQLPVIPQHPRLTPEPVTVTVRAPVYAGPVGPDLAVFDCNREHDQVLPPLRLKGSWVVPMRVSRLVKAPRPGE
jgi:hypothetical protein